MQDYKEVLAEILIDEKSLHQRVRELGVEISADYTDGTLLLICILRGGVPFMVDLSRHITVPHMMDFMAVSSYGVGKRESTGFAAHHCFGTAAVGHTPAEKPESLCAAR
jgi:hypoxanthine phosphoribosyltransferase